MIALGLVTRDWAAVSFGLLGIIGGASIVAVFIVNPTMWEPQNRWKFLGLWIAVGTLVVASLVILVFLLT